MKALLVASYKYHHILAPQMPPFWVTEFSWDTSPPDPKALPMKLAARWTAEALYVMWKVGISMVTWLDIRDNPYPQTATQSGLYLRGATIAQDKPKAILTAFRFPFVAYARKGGIFVWGRTPWGKPGRVVVLPELDRPLEAARVPDRELERDLQRDGQGHADGLPAGTACGRREGGEREEPVVLAQAAAGPSGLDLRKRRIASP